jgi:NADPH-dependent curcumin reductase CurA
LSIDPTQKGWAALDTYLPASKLNEVFRTLGFGKVIVSKHKTVKVDSWVTGLFGSQNYFLTNGEILFGVNVIPNEIIQLIGGPHNFLPVLGVTAVPTVYSGFEIVAGDMDKKGKTLVVSGAAGNCGQWACQLGKQLYGMRVVGIAGTDDKCRYLEEIGCDVALNYKSKKFEEELTKACPNGIDLYYENVGGWITDSVLLRMNKFSRFIFCGSISEYNSVPEGLKNIFMVVVSRIRFQGFIVGDDPSLIPKSYEVVAKLVSEGKVKWKNYELKGIGNFIKGLDSLWSGENTGKTYLSLIN